MSENGTKTTSIATAFSGAGLAGLAMLSQVLKDKKFRCDNCGAETDAGDTVFFECFHLCRGCADRLLGRYAEWCERAKQEMRRFLEEDGNEKHRQCKEA